jgi:hypothetical protein
MLPLEPTSDNAKPAFTDASSCAKWLSQLQLTNLNLAQGTLRAQLDEFNRYPLRGKERLQTLEAMRETVGVVQTDFAKKLAGKKLPLGDDEFKSLIALTSLWQSMINGYLRCLQSAAAGDSSLSSESALLTQRALLYSSQQLHEFLRVGCEPDGKSWQRFHTIYAHAEEEGLQLQPIKDKFNRSGIALSCRTLYAKMLLLHRARLLGLTRNQWHIVDNWLDHWGDSFTIEPRCSMSKGDAPPLAVDMGGMRGFVSIQHATSAPTMRFMAMVPLSKQIRVKTILLQQGQLPDQLELGNELSSKDCVDLLNRLHGCWCELRGDSLADEPRDAPPAQMCHGLDNVYAHIVGKPFKTPNVAGIADKEAQKQIETFGRVLDATDKINLEQLGFLAEDWLVEEDGLLHAKLLRKATSGVRLGLNQIVCVHRPDETSYRVGVTTVVSVARSGQLYINVRYLPGIPHAAIVRGSSSGNLLSGATAALTLPEMPKLRIPASILMPRDWFQSGRTLELAPHDGAKLTVTLGISVEKGNDYERVSFTPKG